MVMFLVECERLEKNVVASVGCVQTSVVLCL